MLVGGVFGGGEAFSSMAPVLRIVRDGGQGFFGRNPCRLGRHRRGAACGWHLPFLKGVVATLRPLPYVLRETLGPVRWSGSQRVLSFFKVLLGI